jgi:hypothetical protein
MELIDNIAMITGYIVFLFVAIAIVIVGLDLTNDEGNYRLFTFFRFGILIVNSDNKTLLDNIRRVRKDDDAGIVVGDSVVFFNAPTWFNKHVINLGVKK